MKLSSHSSAKMYALETFGMKGTNMSHCFPRGEDGRVTAPFLGVCLPEVGNPMLRAMGSLIVKGSIQKRHFY